MIFFDDDSPSKSNRDLPSDIETNRQSHTLIGTVPPPAYGAVDHSPYLRNDDVYPQYDAPEFVLYQKSPMKRFSKALFVALSVWLLLTGLLNIVGLTYRTYLPSLERGVSAVFDIPVDVTLHQCANEEWSSSSDPTSQRIETTFDVSITSATLFLLSRGSLSTGSLRVVTSNEVNDTARVSVTAHYSRREVLGVTKLCLITRAQGENGVGIFTPQGHQENDDVLFFEITVLLPETLEESPVQINNFETDLPNYSHDMGDLMGHVHFRKLSLQGSNYPITGQSLSVNNGMIKTSSSPVKIAFLSADQAKVHTSNDSIELYAYLRESLDLETSNGYIKANIQLKNGKDVPPGSERSTGNLIFLEKNGVYALSSSSGSSSGGNFSISAHTSNAPLLVAIPTSPVDSLLNLDLETSNSMTDLSLPSAYEGTFSLSISDPSQSVLLMYRDDLSDPTGQGRDKILRGTRNKENGLDGYICWEEEHKDRGYANVKATNGPITLRV